MSIDLKDIKIGGGSTKKELNWGDIEDGVYFAELSVVYPWKEITRDTTQKVKVDGKYQKDENGKFITEPLKDFTWNFTDLVFTILEGDYEGLSVRGSLSTHPDMLSSTKQFLYRAKLFDVALADLNKQLGTKIMINVRQRTDVFADKETGLEVTKTYPYVSYYTEIKEEEFGI